MVNMHVMNDQTQEKFAYKQLDPVLTDNEVFRLNKLQSWQKDVLLSRIKTKVVVASRQI